MTNPVVCSIIKTQKREEKKTMTINEMKTNVIHKFGFEHPATICFFECCEINKGDRLLDEIAYEFAINWKDEDEE